MIEHFLPATIANRISIEYQSTTESKAGVSALRPAGLLDIRSIAWGSWKVSFVVHTQAALGLEVVGTLTTTAFGRYLSSLSRKSQVVKDREFTLISEGTFVLCK